MGDWPSLAEFAVALSVPAAIGVTITLALTGYGWGCLWFLIGIPSFTGLFFHVVGNL